MPLLRFTQESAVPMVVIAILVLVAVGGGSFYVLTRSGSINPETIQKSIEQVNTNPAKDNSSSEGKKCVSGNDCAAGFFCSLKDPKAPGECIKIKSIRPQASSSGVKK